MTAAALRIEAEGKRKLAHFVGQMARVISLDEHRKLLKGQVQDLLADALVLDARAAELEHGMTVVPAP
jgi:hypothetical protein